MKKLGKKEVVGSDSDRGEFLKKKEIIGDILVPSSIFLDRRLSVLEALVEYLKEREHLSFREISILLNRDERNIWTVYNRAKKKRENE